MDLSIYSQVACIYPLEWTFTVSHQYFNPIADRNQCYLLTNMQAQFATFQTESEEVEEMEDNRAQANVLDDNQVSCSAHLHPPHCSGNCLMNNRGIKWLGIATAWNWRDFFPMSLTYWNVAKIEEIIRISVIIDKSLSYLWLGAFWGELFQPKWRQREHRAGRIITICPLWFLVLTKLHNCGDRQQQLWKQTAREASKHLWRGTTGGREGWGGAVELVKKIRAFIFCLEGLTCTSVSRLRQKRCVKLTTLGTEGWGAVRMVIKQVSSPQKKEGRASMQTRQIVRKCQTHHILLRSHMVVSPSCSLWNPSSWSWLMARSLIPGEGTSSAAPSESSLRKDPVHLLLSSSPSTISSPSPSTPHPRRTSHPLPPRLYIQPPAPDLGSLHSQVHTCSSSKATGNMSSHILATF